MLYLLAKLIAKFSFLAVYRKVYIINEDNVPGDRATLITCNHPAGFVEPLVIGGYIKHAIYFLVRGDVFEKGWSNFLLRGIHCIPIFRFRDGFASMRKNNESLSETTDILGQKKPLIIFAEGSTLQTRYVRPIQKGTIRLAFDTLEKYPESNPCIIPSVIHFTVPEYYRSEVIMEYGKAIDIADYKELYQTHKAKAIKKLLDDVNTAMQDLSIKIDSTVSTPDADLVLEVARSSAREKEIFPIIQKLSSSPNKDVEYKAGRAFNDLSDQGRSSLLDKIKAIKNQLTAKGITYNQLSKRTKSQTFNFVILILGFIPFVIGRVLNIIPIKLAQRFAKVKVKKIEFKAVMKLCSFLMMYPVYLIILGLIIGFFSWKYLVALLLLPVLGWFSYLYEGHWKEFVANRKFSSLSDTEKQELNKSYQNILTQLSVAAT